MTTKAIVTVSGACQPMFVPPNDRSIGHYITEDGRFNTVVNSLNIELHSPRLWSISYGSCDPAFNSSDPVISHIDAVTCMNPTPLTLSFIGNVEINGLSSRLYQQFPSCIECDIPCLMFKITDSFMRMPCSSADCLTPHNLTLGIYNRAGIEREVQGKICSLRNDLDSLSKEGFCEFLTELRDLKMDFGLCPEDRSEAANGLLALQGAFRTLMETKAGQIIPQMEYLRANFRELPVTPLKDLIESISVNFRHLKIGLDKVIAISHKVVAMTCLSPEQLRLVEEYRDRIHQLEDDLIVNSEKCAFVSREIWHIRAAIDNMESLTDYKPMFEFSWDGIRIDNTIIDPLLRLKIANDSCMPTISKVLYYVDYGGWLSDDRVGCNFDVVM
jgi:hypothetical protein